MNKLKINISIGIVTVCMLALSLAGQAQATRTWVSGVGDDVNPCSRTAPCKTFAGAISKTAAGGEIDVLDPGGFGAVTITKSITIDGTYAAGFGSILASGTNGITVNAATTDVVILRNLSINGAGTGLDGIRYLAARQLKVENCTIFGFTQQGIDVSLTNSGILSVFNSTIENVADGINMTNSAGAMSASLDNVRIRNVTNAGLNLLSGIATISRSTISHNTNFGIIAQGGSTINVESCLITNNGTGLSTNNVSATLRLSNNSIFNNTTGISAGGTVASAGNNKNAGNGIAGAPNSAITVQ